MLYSQIKERSNRFKIALKIGIPFFFIVVIYITLPKIYNLQNKEVFLLLTLSIIYIYYIYYLIYNSFKTTLVDKVTQAFNREYIIHELQKRIKKEDDSVAIMVQVANIDDINERYGINYGDDLLSLLINEIYDFLFNEGFKKVPIGRYSGGYFLILLNGKIGNLKHIFGILKKNLKNENDVELQINFSIVQVTYDKNDENIINYLLDTIDKSVMTTLLKPDVYDKLVCKSIDSGDFVFTYQPFLDFYTRKMKILEVLTKLHVKDFGNLSNKEIKSTINRNRYEVKFYKQNISSIAKEVESVLDEDVVFSLNIPPNILRNSKFIQFMKKLVDKNTLKPQKFILSLYEKNIYEQKNRFIEIIKEYKSMGFGIMLTHFGGNNASLEYIKYLDIDYASFDLEFSKNLEDKHLNIILKQYIQMLQNLGVTSIVKFIETPYAYEVAKNMGVDMVQGHLIGKPQKIDNLKNGEQKV